jgi:hypothetical protein
VTSLASAKAARMQISILKTVADAFQLHAFEDVLVRKVREGSLPSAPATITRKLLTEGWTVRRMVWSPQSRLYSAR